MKGKIIAFIFFSILLSFAELKANSNYEIYYVQGMKIHKIKSDGSRDQVVEPYKLYGMAYHWSPDQNYIAYRTREQGKEIIYLYNAKNGSSHRVNEFDDSSRIIWSPDSTLFAVGIFGIGAETQGKIMIFSTDARMIRELKEENDYLKTHWDNFWWSKDQNKFYLEATYVKNPNLLDKRYISKDIATGEEVILGEFPDYFHNEYKTRGNVDKYFPDRYVQPDLNVPNPRIAKKLGNIYFDNKKITSFKESQYSGMYQGFLYITTLPDSKILLHGPSPKLLENTNDKIIGSLVYSLGLSGQELSYIYVYDPEINQLKALAGGSNSSVRMLEQ